MEVDKLDFWRTTRMSFDVGPEFLEDLQACHDQPLLFLHCKGQDVSELKEKPWQELALMALEVVGERYQLND